jgi:hypothetical protein
MKAAPKPDLREGLEESLREHLIHTGKEKKINETMLWQWRLDRGKNIPEAFFWNFPLPMVEDRALIVGTRSEVGILNEAVEKIRNGEPIPPIRNAKREIISIKKFEGAMVEIFTSEITFTCDTGAFWGDFFGRWDFLDGRVTRPRLIVSTGYIRNYNYAGGETCEVSERLEEIAARYEIPIIFIENFN